MRRIALAGAVLLTLAAACSSSSEQTGPDPVTRSEYATILLNTDATFWRRVDSVNAQLASTDADPTAVAVGGTLGRELRRYIDTMAGFPPSEDMRPQHDAFLTALLAMSNALFDVADIGGDSSFIAVATIRPDLVDRLEARSAELGAACATLVSPLELPPGGDGMRCKDWD